MFVYSDELDQLKVLKNRRKWSLFGTRNVFLLRLGNEMATFFGQNGGPPTTVCIIDSKFISLL